MNQFLSWSLILGITLTSCVEKPSVSRTAERLEQSGADSSWTDINDIRHLIRQTLTWANSDNSINLLPVLTDEKDSVYTGFDLVKHQENLENLRSTGFFAKEFIDNYDQIILTLDKGLKNGTYDQWVVGDLPTFIFSNDVDPWCECQDVPYDDPSPWGFIEIEPISIDKNKGQLKWKWGNLSDDVHPDWKKFSYDFRITREEGKWKIAYLRGFDFKEGTRADGEI